MYDLLYNTPDVAIALRKVEGTELRRGLVMMGMRLELSTENSWLGTVYLNEIGTYDGMRAPLCPNYPTHRLSTKVALARGRKLRYAK